MTDSVWQLQEAKARLSTVILRAQAHEPQVITQHGQPSVIMLAAADYEAIVGHPKQRRLVETLLNAPRMFTHEELEELFGRDRSDVGRDVSFED
jgi:prevent-host-death family protein